MPQFEFYEILDKLIETQVQNAQVAAELKKAVEDNNEHLKDLKKLLLQIDAHFSNGFRQEFKNEIKYAIERIEKNVRERSEISKQETTKILEVVTNFTNCLKNPKSWISAFLLVASIFGTVAAIVTVVTKIVQAP